MARFTLLVAFVVVGLVCLLDHSRALQLLPNVQGAANAPQIPNFPGPGEIPKPPGMLHSRVARDVPHEIPGQDQYPPPAPPPPPAIPSMRTRRDAREPIGRGNSEPSFEPVLSSSWQTTGRREKRSAKGTGGKLPRKSG